MSVCLVIIIIIITMTTTATTTAIMWYRCLLSQAFSAWYFLEPAVIPTAKASSFTLQYFPYCVWWVFQV